MLFYTHRSQGAQGDSKAALAAAQALPLPRGDLPDPDLDIVMEHEVPGATSDDDPEEADPQPTLKAVHTCTASVPTV